MFQGIVDNAGTIVVALALSGIVAAIIAKLYRDKRRGASCGGGCGCCPASCQCHK